MHTATEIAAWLINCNQQFVENNDAELLSPMKIQKLLYYIQGAFLALDNVPLFSDTLEAWKHGPVAPAVYHEYKDFVAGGIDKPRTKIPTVTEHEYALLYAAYEKYNRFSAFELGNMTHREPPYLDAIAQGLNTPIQNDEIKKYFAENVYSKILDGTLFDDIPIVEPLYIDSDGAPVFPAD